MAPSAFQVHFISLQKRTGHKWATARSFRASPCVLSVPPRHAIPCYLRILFLHRNESQRALPTLPRPSPKPIQIAASKRERAIDLSCSSSFRYDPSVGSLDLPSSFQISKIHSLDFLRAVFPGNVGSGFFDTVPSIQLFVFRLFMSANQLGIETRNSWLASFRLLNRAGFYELDYKCPRTWINVIAT